MKKDKLSMIVGTLFTVEAALCALYAVLSIYFGYKGKGQLYTLEKLRSRILALLISLVVFIIAITFACWLNRGEKKKSVLSPKLWEKETQLPRPLSNKSERILRIAVAVIGIVLVVYGILNGSLRDVLVKAINICSECIGLG